MGVSKAARETPPCRFSHVCRSDPCSGNDTNRYLLTAIALLSLPALPLHQIDWRRKIFWESWGFNAPFDYGVEAPLMEVQPRPRFRRMLVLRGERWRRDRWFPDRTALRLPRHSRCAWGLLSSALVRKGSYVHPHSSIRGKLVANYGINKAYAIVKWNLENAILVVTSKLLPKFREWKKNITNK